MGSHVTALVNGSHAFVAAGPYCAASAGNGGVLAYVHCNVCIGVGGSGRRLRGLRALLRSSSWRGSVSRGCKLQRGAALGICKLVELFVYYHGFRERIVQLYLRAAVRALFGAEREFEKFARLFAAHKRAPYEYNAARLFVIGGAYAAGNHGPVFHLNKFQHCFIIIKRKLRACNACITA